MRISKAEQEFRSKYPHARVEASTDLYTRNYIVFAGDYICAESYSRSKAFAKALRLEADGMIQPDPSEKQGEFAA